MLGISILLNFFNVGAAFLCYQIRIWRSRCQNFGYHTIAIILAKSLPPYGSYPPTEFFFLVLILLPGPVCRPTAQENEEIWDPIFFLKIYFDVGAALARPGVVFYAD